MAKHQTNFVSSDKTMAKWPVNLDPNYDLITPYPCMTCKRPFSSRKGLRTHECKPSVTVSVTRESE